MRWGDIRIPWWMYRANRVLKTKKVVKALVDHYGAEQDGEVQLVIKYVKKNGMAQYPCAKEGEYYKKKIGVYRDEDGYPYVFHDGKKLYFLREQTDVEVRENYRTLLFEQDECNPHHYLEEDRRPLKSDVVADIGVAEGIFSLSVIDDVRKVYLFEADEKWVGPLQRTFKKYGDKVEIVRKYVSNIDNENSIKLDSYFDKKDITYLKADIEGYEMHMLQGAEKTLKNKIKRAVICAYHREADEKDITKIMCCHGFREKVNKGFVLHNMDIYTGKLAAYHQMRRGVIWFFKE